VQRKRAKSLLEGLVASVKGEHRFILLAFTLARIEGRFEDAEKILSGLPREDFRTYAMKGLLYRDWGKRGKARNAFEEAVRMGELVESGEVRPCALDTGGRTIRGWIGTSDLELVERLRSVRPRRDRGVLLSPFDPVLWDRRRVALLFGFDQVLEIFKPASQRRYGYYCLPVLAGETLVARVDLKAERAEGRLRVLSRRFESTGTDAPADAREEKVLFTALRDHAERLELRLSPG